MANDDQQSHVPDLESFLQGLYEGSWGSSPEQALGLYQNDPFALISPVTSPTTPVAPSSIYVLGMATEIGVAWQFFKLLGNSTVRVEVRRATQADMSDAVSLGEFQGFFMVDDNNYRKWAASTTRYYQVRTIATSGETNYFSPWVGPIGGTTLPVGSTNTDLQTRMNTFGAAVQGLHLFPLAIPGPTVDLDTNPSHISLVNRVSANSAAGGSGSATSNKVSILIAGEVSSRLSADNALSNAISVLSNQVSALSQAHSALSQDVSARLVSVNNSISVISQAVSVLSQTVSVLSNALSVLSAFDVGVRLFHSLTQTISTGGISVLSFDTERWDTNGFHNATSATQITIPAGQGGKYLIGVATTWDANATGIRVVGIRLNGATFHLLIEANAVSGGATTRLAGAVVMNLIAGDYLEFVVQQTSGAPLATQSASDYTPVFWAQKLEP